MKRLVCVCVCALEGEYVEVSITGMFVTTILPGSVEQWVFCPDQLPDMHRNITEFIA
jgi:hypothetical protein